MNAFETLALIPAAIDSLERASEAIGQRAAAYKHGLRRIDRVSSTLRGLGVPMPQALPRETLVPLLVGGFALYLLWSAKR